jgi:regulator of nonsense transcripts 2
MALDNRDQIMKDIESLSLEKYIDELVGAIIEGLGRCKTEKDVWGAVEIEDFFVLFSVYSLVTRSFLFYTGASQVPSRLLWCPISPVQSAPHSEHL